MKKLKAEIAYIKVSQKSQHIHIINAFNMIYDIIDKNISKELIMAPKPTSGLSAMQKAEAIKEKYKEKI